MSGSRTVPIGRGGRGENRFYNPPHVRKQQLFRRQQEEEERKQRVERERERRRLEKRTTESDECESVSNCTVSFSESTNLDRFLESTTPVVPAQYLPKRCSRLNENYKLLNFIYLVAMKGISIVWFGRREIGASNTWRKDIEFKEALFPGWLQKMRQKERGGCTSQMLPRVNGIGYRDKIRIKNTY